MKGRILIIATALFIIFAMCSCTKERTVENSSDGDIRLTFNISDSHDTKSVYDIGSLGEDGQINSLILLVYNNDRSSSKYGYLETSRHLTVSDLSNVSFKTTLGSKIIYAVSNIDTISMTQAQTLDGFREITTSISTETFGRFKMIGNVNYEVGADVTKNIVLTRLVARIQINSIGVNFDGSWCDGKTLSDIKIYLINVRDRVYMYSGASAGSSFFNHKGYNAYQSGSCLLSDIIYEGNVGSIQDNSSHSAAHVFHCYENTIGSESDNDRFTRLVIEGKIDGTAYYYPISINQNSFGSTSYPLGVEANKWYKMDVTILRPGTDSPDVTLDKGTVTVSISTVNWTVIDNGNIEF